MEKAKRAEGRGRGRGRGRDGSLEGPGVSSAQAANVSLWSRGQLAFKEK